MELLERELLDKEKMSLDREVEMSRVRSVLNWLVKEGVVRIVDKVIKLPTFFHGVGRIKHLCFSAREESRRDPRRRDGGCY